MKFTFRRSASVRLLGGLMAICLLFGLGAAFGQRLDGTLRGDAVDKDGAYITEAKVTATDPATGVTATTSTSSAGTFVFPNMLVGKYTVTIEKPGFSRYQVTNVEVIAGQTNEVHAKMRVGSEGTVVEVTSGAELVKTESSDLSTTIPAQVVINLPFSNANGTLMDLAQLAPGVVQLGGGVLGEGGSVGGTRPRFNSFTIDGVDDNRTDITGHTSTVINDAVAEFDLVTNQFSAEYGHSAGAQFQIVTKSGTNNWHGSAFERFANRKLDAFDNQQKLALPADCTTASPADPLLCDKPRFDYNVAGGSIGGPIIKNRAFIFGAYQQQWAGFAGSSTSFETPTAAGLAALQGIAQDQAVKDILSQFPAAGGAITKTLSVKNNQSGATVQVPVGLFSALGPSFLNERDFQINGDINLDKQQVRARFLYNRLRNPDLPAPPIPQFIGSTAYDVRKALLTDVYTINSHYINDLRLSWTQRVGPSPVVPGNFETFPNVIIKDLSNFEVGPETNAPQSGFENLYQILDQQTYIHGKHTFKWGVEARRWIIGSNFLPRARGEWQYATTQEFINDYVPTVFAKQGAGSGNFNGSQYGFNWFLQDDVKVNSRLTLNLGIRYEWQGISSGEHLQLLNAIASAPGTPMVFHLPTTEKKNFAPRVGFAWDPKGDGKWAVRGGFALAYDIQPQNFPQLELPPQLQSEQDPNITCSLPSPRSWCASYAGGAGPGLGFLGGGGLASVNLPPTNQIQARNRTQGVMNDHILPRVFTWSFGVQHELFKDSSLELRYLGTRGEHLLVQTQLNARTAFANGATPLPEFFSAADVPASFTGAPTLANFNSFKARPYASLGFLGSTTTFLPTGTSNYHGVSADFIHRMSRGLYVRANYTYSHTIDTATNELFSSLVNPRRAQDSENIQGDKGNSVLDIVHKAAFSWNYDLPRSHGDSGIVKGLLNGWVLAGDYIITSGQPVTFQSFQDVNGNGDSAGDRAMFNPAGDPQVGSGVVPVCWNGTTTAFGGFGSGPGFTACSAAQTVGYIAGSVTGTGVFTGAPNAGYATAGIGTLSNVGRNTGTSPGRNNLNLTLAKNTYIKENMYVQLRIESFNLLNHRQFSFTNPGGIALPGIDTSAIAASGYADPSDTQFRNPQQLNGGSRNLQLGVRFVF